MIQIHRPGHYLDIDALDKQFREQAYKQYVLEQRELPTQELEQNFTYPLLKPKNTTSFIPQFPHLGLSKLRLFNKWNTISEIEKSEWRLLILFLNSSLCLISTKGLFILLYFSNILLTSALISSISIL